MTKTLSMVSHIITSVLVRVLFFTSKLISCFIVGFTSSMKSHSIAYLTQWKWIYIYWILNLEDETHLIWDLWRSGLQECKGSGIFGSRAGHAEVFGAGPKNPDFFVGQLTLTEDASLERLVGGRISSSLILCILNFSTNNYKLWKFFNCNLCHWKYNHHVACLIMLCHLLSLKIGPILNDKH